MYRTDFWTLWEKARVGCSERIALKQVYYQGWNRSPAQVGCVRQVLRAGALGRPRGMGWGGRWEGGSGWGTHVNPWLIHVNVWQKPLQCCKVISLQLIKINGEKTTRTTKMALIPVTSWWPSFGKLTLGLRISPYVCQSDRRSVHSECGLGKTDISVATFTWGRVTVWRPLSPLSSVSVTLCFSHISRRWGLSQSVQSLSCVWLFATPWTAAHQASLSITSSRRLLRLMGGD